MRITRCVGVLVLLGCSKPDATKRDGAAAEASVRAQAEALVPQFAAMTPQQREATAQQWAARCRLDSTRCDDVAPAQAVGSAGATDEERGRLRSILSGGIVSRAAMGGKDGGEIDRTALTLAAVAESHAGVDVLSVMPTTTRKLVLKDPDAERGKVLTFEAKRLAGVTSGTNGEAFDMTFGGVTVTEIRREGAYFVGTMWSEEDNDPKIYKFLTPFDTGDIVDGTRSGFSGVFVHEYAYLNVSGGQTRALVLVGAFVAATGY